MGVQRTVAHVVEADTPPVKGSRFRGRLVPVGDEVEIRQALEDVAREHPQATHHAYAWRLAPDGGRWRAHDAGEPKGTAGLPLMRRLEGSGLVDALLIVTRWYGGTQLGVGGLARAYGDAAAAVLALAPVVERIERRAYALRHAYADGPAVESLLRAAGLEPRESSYTDEVLLVLDVPVADVERLAAALRDATRGHARFDAIAP
ncbi:MAG: YigZ family protein [Planctomycetes bacterium]|nr:YigZ family protein [Planctomycetota bacterium]MCB9828192.1 YigZ family protein [Planctomycetota bacterium]